MKVTVLFGSPRAGGNTAQLLAPCMDELKKAGAQTAYYSAYDLRVGGCRACLMCQKDTEHIVCALQDDMQPIYRDLAGSDLILAAAPVYLWSFPAPEKAILDRFVYASCKYYAGDPHGPALLQGKKFAVLTTCGYPEEKGGDLLGEAMRRFCKHCRMDYAGMLIERQRNFREPFMNAEKEEHARSFVRGLCAAL